MALPYAKLSDVTEAIRQKRIIRFLYEGKDYEVEPHSLGQRVRTSAYVLVAYVRGAEEGWQKFTFCEIRGMDIVLHSHFQERALPKLLGLRSAPLIRSATPRP